MLINRSKFQQEHGYDPMDESIPHVISVKTIQGLEITEKPSTSFMKALLDARIMQEANPRLTEKIPVIFIIYNVSGAGNENRLAVAKLVSIPDSMSN